MNCRERVLKVLDWESADIPVVQYLYPACSFYEHGDRIQKLYAENPGDFGPYFHREFSGPPPEAFNADGRYYEEKTDDWGTLWNYTIYGMAGHVLKPPIEDVSQYDNYIIPPLANYRIPSFDDQLKAGSDLKKEYPHMEGGIYSYMERLYALRGFEEVLMDLIEDGPEINRFLDRLTDSYMVHIFSALDSGADIVAFGDDLGTQQGLIISRELFNHAIKPRLKRLMDPVVKAGKKIYYHSCGKMLDLCDELKEIGVTSIWPQMPAYDMKELAYTCRYLGLACALHPDRAYTMTLGTPDMVRELVHNINDVFKPREGGSWFHIEIDAGFPFDNVEALITEIFKLRK